MVYIAQFWEYVNLTEQFKKTSSVEGTSVTKKCALKPHGGFSKTAMISKVWQLLLWVVTQC